jgi:hypothetical protein
LCHVLSPMVSELHPPPLCAMIGRQSVCRHPAPMVNLRRRRHYDQNPAWESWLRHKGASGTFCPTHCHRRGNEVIPTHCGHELAGIAPRNSETGVGQIVMPEADE